MIAHVSKLPRVASVLMALALASLVALPSPAGAGPAVTDTMVSVGSPHNIAPRSHQNEPVVAVDAHNPDVLVAGSNDYIDQQACPKDLATQQATCDDFSAGIGVTGLYFSFDRGKSWIQPTYSGWQA